MTKISFSFKNSFLIPLNQALNRLPNSRFIAIFMGVYLAFGITGMLHHELWRDEANVWLHGLVADSWGDLFNNISYDGHPWLWYIAVYGLAQITEDPRLMQLFHFGIAAGFTYVMLRYAPFSRLQRILFCFGYYGAYEYALISRNYAFGILGTFLFCALFATRRHTYLGLALSLALMMQANIFATILAIAAIPALVVDYALSRESWLNTRGKWLDLALSVGIVGGVGWISLDQMIPGDASSFASGWVLYFDQMRALDALSRLSSNYLVLIKPHSASLDLGLFAIASLLLFLLFAQSLRHKPAALTFYTLATLGILGFSYFKFLGGIRHTGHLAIALIAALWIANYYPDPAREQSPRRPWQNWPALVLTMLLTGQAIAGILQVIYDIRYPFSSGKATAQYLKTAQLDQEFIVGSPDYAMASITVYLNRQFYYPETQKLGSFTRFTIDRNPVDQSVIIEQVKTLFEERSLSQLILILNEPLSVEDEALCVEYLTEFTESLAIADEVFYLYRVEFRCSPTLRPQ